MAFHTVEQRQELRPAIASLRAAESAILVLRVFELSPWKRAVVEFIERVASNRPRVLAGLLGAASPPAKPFGPGPDGPRGAAQAT